MNEQLISYETAILAKEKGWNYYSSSFCYNKSKLTLKDLRDHHFVPEYDAPTQSLLQKWLREEHNLIIEINFNINYSFKIYYYEDDQYWVTRSIEFFEVYES